MYAIVYTRLDIAYRVSLVSRYMSNLGKQYLEAVKWVLRYLGKTVGVGLKFRKLETRKSRIL